MAWPPRAFCVPPSCPAQANVREAVRDYRKLTAVPKDLAQREAELESHGYQVRSRQGPPCCLVLPSTLPSLRRGTGWGCVGLGGGWGPAWLR